MIRKTQTSISEKTPISLSNSSQEIHLPPHSDTVSHPEESEELEQKTWDDYEDDTYDEWDSEAQEKYQNIIDEGEKESPAPEPQLNPRLISDNDHLHSVLVHRYDQEIQRMNSLHTQSIFILTALGFLVTIAVSIMGADWFSFRNFDGSSLILIVLDLVPLIFFASMSGYLAWKVMSRIDGNTKHTDEFCWEYPDDKTLELCNSSAVEIFVDKRTLCRTLAFTINHNYNNNQKMKQKLNKSLTWLFGAFCYSICIVVIIFLLSYFATPNEILLNAENVTMYANTLITP